MRARSFILLSFILTTALALPGEAGPISAQGQVGASVVPDRVSDCAPTTGDSQNAGTLFIENVGQFADGARFQVRGGPATMWLSEDALWMTLLERREEQRQCPSP